MTTTAKPFDHWVKEYEWALRSSAFVDGMTPTITLLDGLTSACAAAGLVESGVSAMAREHWYTRAAAALTKFITHPKTRLTVSSVKQIARRKQTIVYIFNASGYRNMSHIVDLVTVRHQDGSEKINTKQAAALLAFIGLDDVPDVLMDIALLQPQWLIFYLMIGWLNQRAVLTAQGERNRGRLLTSGHLLADFELSDDDLPFLINSWMYSSYAEEPDKHAIKKWYNHLIMKRMASAGVEAKPVVYSRVSRPKILVIHERFTKEHAMFRCYSPMVKTLGKYFDTVALTDAAMIDEPGKVLFDQVILLPTPRPTIESIAELIQAQNADIIYYPSLGMSHWTVMVAALRLAPLQVMTQGHPATSMLETIDYVYLTSLRGNPSPLYSEKLIVSPEDLTFTAHTELGSSLPSLLPASLREVRIAVNSKVMKLSWRLLKICQRLERESLVPVRFSFFPGERFQYMDGLEAAIRAQLPSATVELYTSYENFLEQMCKCDVALAAFPFGNTNSTVDACLLGLPTVAHFGAESPAQTDALVLQAAGLPNWLVCSDDEAYFQTALKLVNEPEARIEALAGLDRKALRDSLIENSALDQSNPFGEVLFKLYRNLEEVEDSTKRLYDYSELLALSD